MKAFLWCLFFFTFTGQAIASARVCIRGNELEVYSNLIFYGAKAKAAASPCANEIFRMFNQPKVNLKVNGKALRVKFKISYQVEKEEAVYSSVNINSRVENNYIRVEDKAFNEPNGRSNHNLKSNCGYYAYSDDLGSSTTCAHEYAHGLGLIHYNERKSGYGSKGDLRGQGKPGIMAARGFLVDSQYQWDPKAVAGKAGGTIRPVNREVRAQDILDLDLTKLKFDKYGCAPLGKIEGYAYTREGKQTKGDQSYLADAVNYVGKILSGKVEAPVFCK